MMRHSNFCAEVVRQLRAAAATHPETVGKHVHPSDRISFLIDGCAIACRPTAPALLALAEKYRKGAMQTLRSAPLPRPYTLKRPPDADKRLAALEAELSDFEQMSKAC